MLASWGPSHHHRGRPTILTPRHNAPIDMDSSACYNGEVEEDDKSMNKVSMSELSRRTGLSVSFISRLIGGKRKPSMNTIMKLSVATGMNEDKVLRWLGWRKSGRRKA